MRYVLVSEVGTGTNAEPFRVPLPNYETVFGPVGGKRLVRIPDEDVRDALGELPAANTRKLSAWLAAAAVPAATVARIVAEYGDPDVTIAVDAATLNRWRQHLDKRYKEHAGQYGFIVG